MSKREARAARRSAAERRPLGDSHSGTDRKREARAARRSAAERRPLGDSHRGTDDCIWSIGHSNRSADDLCATLAAAGVRQVADVRRIPASRRHPQHARAALERALAAAGIRYAWLGSSLGGRMPERLAPEASPNRGWTEPAFRNFADALPSPELQGGLAELDALARATPTAFLCAERDFASCHRRIVADALVVRGWRVLHLEGPGRATEHALPPFARVDAGVLTYPALL